MASSQPLGGPAPDECAFIVSTGRTGTQFFGHRLQEMVDDCASFHEPGTPWLTRPRQTLKTLVEFGPLKATVGQLTPWYGTYKLSRDRLRGVVGDEDAIRWLREMRRRLFERLDASLYIEASGHLYGLCDLLPAAFPGSKVVIVVRDPRTWVWSALRTPEYYLYGPLDESFVKLSIRGPDVDEGVAAEWPSMSKFEKYCWFYGLSNQLLLDHARGRQDAVVFRFEDLFGQPSKEAFAELLSFVAPAGPGQGPRFSLERARLDDKVHSNAAPGVADYSTWSDEEVAAVERFCRPMMDRFGYGEEPAWRSRVSATGLARAA